MLTLKTNRRYSKHFVEETFGRTARATLSILGMILTFDPSGRLESQHNGRHARD